MGDSPTLKLVSGPLAAEQGAKPRPQTQPRIGTRARRILAVGGGKGGIGKSLISANVGIELARRGRRVVLVDADLGGANLHTCLGIEQPRRTLSEFIERRLENIEEVASPTGIPNLTLVSGAMDQLDVANPRYAQKMRLLRQVQTMDVDYAILDLGAGTQLNTLDFFLVSDHGLLVLVPEPTAVENAYRFVKAAFWRRLRNVATVFGAEPLLRRLLEEGAFQSPLEIVHAISERDRDVGEYLSQQMQAFRPRLVVNQARTQQDVEIGRAVVTAWRRYFGLNMDYLGVIEYEDDVWKTVRARRPLLLEYPGSRAARSVGRIVDGLLALDAGSGDLW
ncbi:MAG TPA: P-loop NTPase [Anaeromyxobacteraceae bacterium]|nr:P-loop NTPase [Anaeromyxobacteraceae bacterium]